MWFVHSRGLRSRPTWTQDEVASELRQVALFTDEKRVLYRAHLYPGAEMSGRYLLCRFMRHTQVERKALTNTLY
jgi:hypothetical protein